MKILITGITGFVGSHLAEYFLKKSSSAVGYKIYGIKRWRSPLDNILHILDKIELFDCDLLEPKALYKIMETVKPDFIFHLAAQSYVPFSFSNPLHTFSANVLGTINLYEAVKAAGTSSRIHYCSSSEVYGQVKEKDLPIKESQPFRPASPYAASKASADLLSRVYYENYDLPIIITRAFTHTGPRRGEVFVVSAFAKQIAEIEKGKKEPILYVGNLDSLRTFLDVRDIVNAYHLLLIYGSPGEVYNVGGIYTMTIREMLERLLDQSSERNNIEIKVDHNLLRPVDVTLQVPDCTKLHNAIQWKPTYTFDETLHDTLEYWRKKV